MSTGLMSHRRDTLTRVRPAALVAVLLVVADAHAGAPQSVPDALVADVIFVGGRIVTVNERFDIVEALAVRKGRIVAVGRNAAIRRLAGPTTRVQELAGKTVLPGFYDSHVHLRIGPGPDVHDWRDVTTAAELRERLRAANAAGQPEAWVSALLGFRWSEQDLPTRTELDRLVPDHPLDVMVGAHLMLVNSPALRLAGIDARTPDPPGGRIVRDANGEPTGWLEDAPSWRAVWERVPWTFPDNAETLSRIRRQTQEWLAHGITSANVAGVRPFDGADPYRYVDMPVFGPIQSLYARDGAALPRLTVEIRLFPGFEEHANPEPDGVRAAVAELEALAIHTGFGDERLKIGAIKMSIDGGDAGSTSFDYRGRPGVRGSVRIPEPVLYAVAKRAKELGWQLGLHVMGDAATASAVDVLERVYRELGPGDYRDHFHHVAVAPPAATLAKMAALHIAVSSQPNFLSYRPLLDALEGPARDHATPQRTLFNAGLHIGYGSDSVPYDPLYGIWSAVTRRGADGAVIGADERVTLQQAIRAYTIGSAWLTFDETTRGSLEVGKLADMVVLDRDILSVPPSVIKDLKVEQTVLGGAVVYTRSAVP